MSPEVICCCGGGVISATNPKFDSFLGRLGLNECAPALAEAGVDCSEDLTEWTEDEVVKEGLKRGHVKKKLMKAILPPLSVEVSRGIYCSSRQATT